MPIVKIKENVKIGNITQVSGTYQLPNEIICPLNENVKMKYDKKKGVYRTEELGGVEMTPENYLRNEISRVNYEEECKIYEKQQQIIDEYTKKINDLEAEIEDQRPF